MPATRQIRNVTAGIFSRRPCKNPYKLIDSHRKRRATLVVNIRRLQNTLIEQKAILTTEGRTFDEEVEVEFRGESEAISAGTVGKALV